jgi:putative ABC transport system permease protein
MRDQALQEVEWIMRRLRKLDPQEKNDFDISTPDSIISQFDQFTSIIWVVSLALSGLGLLVGGIGVMNIMLVSVTERTREIGVRKAIGARKVDVISQFMMEAMTLTGLGGVVGILFSVSLGCHLPQPQRSCSTLGAHRWFRRFRRRRLVLRRLASGQGG